MYSGHKIQAGTRQSFAQAPFHPYTDLLIHSVPELRQGWLENCGTTCGQLPPIGAKANVPELCTFLSRCPVRVDGLCNRTAPSRRIIEGGSEILCHHDSADLLKTQQDLITMSQGAYA
jgi:peptide/nickel transport system ATP-binding protein